MGTKTIGFVLALIMPLVLVSAVMAVQVTTPATVTVNSFISFTVTPCSPMSFGSLDPGTTDKPIMCQSSGNITTGPALGLSVDAITNVAVNVGVKGQDFIYSPSTIPITNVEYDDDGSYAFDVVGTKAKGSLTTSYVTYWLSVGGTGSAWTNGLWYWMDVPSTFLVAGTYTGSLDVQAT